MEETLKILKTYSIIQTDVFEHDQHFSSFGDIFRTRHYSTLFKFWRYLSSFRTRPGKSFLMHKIISLDQLLTLKNSPTFEKEDNHPLNLLGIFTFPTFTFIQNQPTSSGGRKPSNFAKQAAAVLGKERKLGKKDALEKDGASTREEREGS